MRGKIVFRRDRARRSSAAMSKDPYTLLIALKTTSGGGGSATGSLYMDGAVYTFIYTIVVLSVCVCVCVCVRSHYEWEEDGHSFEYQTAQAFAVAVTSMEGKVIRNKVTGKFSNYNTVVERIIVAGYAAKPGSVAVQEFNLQLEFTYDAAASVLVIKKPMVPVAGAWSIVIN